MKVIALIILLAAIWLLLFAIWASAEPYIVGPVRPATIEDEQAAYTRQMRLTRSLAAIGVRYTPQSYLVAVRRGSDRAFSVPAELADDAEAIAKWQRKHRWSPNQLRHAMATKVRRDFDIEAAKVLLGHSQINMSGHYAEQDRRRAIEVAKMIG